MRTFGARKPGVIAGLDVAQGSVSRARQERRLRAAGSATATASTAGAIVARVSGNARALLTAERVALNFLCRMSGIATLTRNYVDAVAGTKAQHRRHAQDDARPARLREICRALRRRPQPPPRPVRRHPDQGQSHRRRRRHRPRHRGGARARRAHGQDRGRGHEPRRAARGARSTKSMSSCSTT